MVNLKTNHQKKITGFVGSRQKLNIVKTDDNKEKKICTGVKRNVV